MNSKEIRRKNLLTLLAGYKTKRQFAEAVNLAPGHVSQMANGHRDMGDSVARRIEQALKLPPGWMDVPPEEVLSPEERTLVEKYRQMADQDRKTLQEVGAALASKGQDKGEVGNNVGEGQPK